jgi:ADP-dependent phosphofructokinase/glucokinase
MCLFFSIWSYNSLAIKKWKLSQLQGVKSDYESKYDMSDFLLDQAHTISAFRASGTISIQVEFPYKQQNKTKS